MALGTVLQAYLNLCKSPPDSIFRPKSPFEPARFVTCAIQSLPAPFGLIRLYPKPVPVLPDRVSAVCVALTATETSLDFARDDRALYLPRSISSANWEK